MEQSLDNVQDYSPVWATCPADILFMVFKKLDIKSITNCMDVNIFWRNVVRYYCEHFKLWKKVVQNNLDDDGETFTEKSKLDWQDQFLTAQRWLNVSNASVSLEHHYKFDNIISMWVCEDNLIVATAMPMAVVALKYDIKNIKVIKDIKDRLHPNTFKYEETSSWILELSSPGIINGTITHCVLTLTNKLFKGCDPGPLRKSVKYLNVSLYKVHLNNCYVVDIFNVLWMYTATETELKSSCLAKYYGNQDSIEGMHIHGEDVYILLKRGDVLRFDNECKAFVKIFHFKVPLHCLNSKQFQTFSYLIRAHKSKSCIEYFEVFSLDQDDFIIRMSRTGITCALQHGHTLIMGYDDGKVEIYLTRKLIESQSCTVPELVFNLQTYVDKTNQKVDTNLKITSLDIYEDKKGHHLFVSTCSVIYELLLHY